MGERASPGTRDRLAPEKGFVVEPPPQLFGEILLLICCGCSKLKSFAQFLIVTPSDGRRLCGTTNEMLTYDLTPQESRERTESGISGPSRALSASPVTVRPVTMNPGIRRARSSMDKIAETTLHG